MSRYLVTGGAGFIGRQVCRELVEHGHEVRVLDFLIQQVHGPEPRVELPDAEFLRGDVRDAEAVRRALQGVTGVVHLAAEVGVGQSMYEIERYVSTNDTGTAVLLEALIHHPVERIVVASSMSVYGEGRYRTADGRAVDNVRRDAQRVAAGQWDPRSADGEPLFPVPSR